MITAILARPGVSVDRRLPWDGVRVRYLRICPIMGRVGMGMMDKAKDMKDKAKDAVTDEHIDKAGDAVDEKTGGQHADKVDKGQDMAKEQTQKMRQEQ